MIRSLFVLMFLLMYNLSFGAQAVSSTTSGGSSCTCQAGYNVCQSSSLFMSCCACCQAGASCGSWSAFGLCGCTCENANSLVVNPVKYKEFLDWCATQEIPTDALYTILYTMMSEDDIATLKATHNPVFLDDNAVVNFAIQSRNIINTFSETQKALINEYTNQ